MHYSGHSRAEAALLAKGQNSGGGGYQPGNSTEFISFRLSPRCTEGATTKCIQSDQVMSPLSDHRPFLSVFTMTSRAAAFRNPDAHPRCVAPPGVATGSVNLRAAVIRDDRKTPRAYRITECHTRHIDIRRSHATTHSATRKQGHRQPEPGASRALPDRSEPTQGTLTRLRILSRSAYLKHSERSPMKLISPHDLDHPRELSRPQSTSAVIVSTQSSHRTANCRD